MRTTYLMLNIRYLRKSKNLSQTQIGSMLGVGASMISAYESGKHLPSTEILFSISDIFQVKLDDLVFTNLAEKTSDKVNEPKPTYPKIGITSTNSSESMLRLVTMLEQELYELRERIKKEAPDLAERWGIR